MKRLAIILALMGGSLDAQGLDNGNMIYGACTESDGEPTVQFGYCIGYFTGVWEGLKLGIALPMMMAGDQSTENIEQLSNRLLRVCLPKEADRRQIIDVTVQYLADNPGTRHLPARMLTWNALTEAFPCE